MSSPSTRAIVFIDGANLYHALKVIGVRANRVDPYRVARKLVEPSTLHWPAISSIWDAALRLDATRFGDCVGRARSDPQSRWTDAVRDRSVSIALSGGTGRRGPYAFLPGP